MIPAPQPHDESDRLHALRAFLILDTAPEERFDRVVAFPVNEFDMPIALVSLVDSHRQWFKSRIGLAVCETGRDVTLLAQVREGPWLCPMDTPVAVTVDHCDADLALQLRGLNVRRVLLKPFKVKGVIETITGLCAAPEAAS